jgi:Phage related hypothetical protein (DUF1799)
MQSPPTESEARGLGLTLKEAQDAAVFGVWPDNFAAVNAFISLTTQWRVGFAGATGLDYGALIPVFRMTKIPRADWSDIFESIRVLEDATLVLMRRKK